MLRLLCAMALLLPATAHAQLLAWVNVNEENFPDAVFRAYVSSNFDTDGDGKLTASEIVNAKVINLDKTNQSDKVHSLVGVEHLTALTSLDVTANALTSLDVSKNTQLIVLNCARNQLEELDVTQNTALLFLTCNNNQIWWIDLSKNTSLKSLICSSNDMSLLNVTQNEQLMTLECAQNKLKKLNVTQNTALRRLDCLGNQLTALNLSYNTSLTYLRCSSNPIDTLDVSHNTALTNLLCEECQLTELDVTQNTALKDLTCARNQLEELDVSQNTLLEDLECSYNLLTALDVSENTALTYLGCTDNQLYALDVSHNTNLENIKCSNNHLSAIDLKYNTALTADDGILLDGNGRTVEAIDLNGEPAIKVGTLGASHGNIVFTPLPEFMGLDVDKMTDIQGFTIKRQNGVYLVFDRANDGHHVTYNHPTGYTGTNTLIPATVEFFLDWTGDYPEGLAIDEEHFPDAVFRAYVSDNFDSDHNGFLNDTEIAHAKTIDMTYATGTATSLAGVEYLTALKSLACNTNCDLTALDVSHNTALTMLNCGYNQLTALDVSHNTALTTLNCSHNQLEALNVRQNAALESLMCEDNMLTELDVTANEALLSLFCGSNQLKRLDLSQNTLLQAVWCANNQLSAVDLSQNPALIKAVTENNGRTVEATFLDGEPAVKVGTIELNHGNVGFFPEPDFVGLDIDKMTDIQGFTVKRQSVVYLVFDPANASQHVTYRHPTGYSGSAPSADVPANEEFFLDWTMGIPVDEEHFPDEVFRDYVSTFIDTDGNGYLISSEIAAATTIQMYRATGTARSLAGVEYLTALTYLDASQNCNLTALDVSLNTALNYLSCADNYLTSLDVTHNTALESLNCSHNLLTALDLSKNKGFKSLQCDHNLLTALDVSHNLWLDQLYCSDNQIKALNLRNNLMLCELDCRNNQLSAIDLSHNPNLTDAYLSNNGKTMTVDLLEGMPAVKVGDMTGGTFVPLPDFSGLDLDLIDATCDFEWRVVGTEVYFVFDRVPSHRATYRHATKTTSVDVPEDEEFYFVWKLGLQGDVKGDGVVSGADVTALYNVLLDGAEAAGDADVNGDGVVNGSDVTALYNILLN
ncbi:MAG: hypothetical protein J6X70_08515 [Muribaculaceae bacterium]|nr:hypothetical protein [Muribaculaceae bacterium]